MPNPEFRPRGGGKRHREFPRISDDKRPAVRKAFDEGNHQNDAKDRPKAIAVSRCRLSPSERKDYPIRIQTAAAATMLGVSKRTVHGMAARGELPGAARIGKVWTFNADKLAQLIADREAECSKSAAPTIKRAYGSWVPPLSERESKEAYERAMSKWLGPHSTRRSPNRVTAK
jgi:hypothetical protein